MIFCLKIYLKESMLDETFRNSLILSMFNQCFITA